MNLLNRHNQILIKIQKQKIIIYVYNVVNRILYLIHREVEMYVNNVVKNNKKFLMIRQNGINMMIINNNVDKQIKLIFFYQLHH